MSILKSLAFVFAYMLIFFNIRHLVPDSLFTWINPDFYPLIAYAIMLIWVLLLSRKSNLNIGKGFYINRFYPVNIAATLLITAGLWFAAQAVISSSLLSGYMPDYNDYMQDVYTGSFTFSLITLCIIAPIAEELLFRGAVLGEMTPCMPFHLANVIQALIFAVSHGNIIQGAYTFIVGWCLGFSYRRSGNIYMSIAIHILFNSANAFVFMPDISFPYMEYVMILLAALLLWSGLYITRGGKAR